MMWMRKWLALSLILISCCPALADDAHDGASPTTATSGAGSTDRNAADLKLPDYVVDFLWKAFPKLTKDQLKERFNTTLPAAMNEARDDKDGKSCGKLTTLMIPLLGTYADHRETDALLKEIAEAEKKDGARPFPDRSFNALLKRLRWMAGVMKGEPNEKFPEFNKCFNDEFDAYQKKQDEFWAKVNDAANNPSEATRQAALQYIAKNTVPGELKTFMEKFAPQAQASTSPRLKKWAENLQKASPGVEKLTSPPAATALGSPATAATGSGAGAGTPGSGAGGAGAGIAGSANPAPSLTAADAKAKLFAAGGAKCQVCHRGQVELVGGPGANNIRVKFADGSEHTFANMLSKISNMGQPPAVAALLQKWVHGQ